MSQQTAIAHATVGERVELSRYSVAKGERVIYGERINGIVRIVDRPATGHGHCYLVECGLDEALDAGFPLTCQVRILLQPERPVRVEADFPTH